MGSDSKSPFLSSFQETEPGFLTGFKSSPRINYKKDLAPCTENVPTFLFDFIPLVQFMLSQKTSSRFPLLLILLFKDSWTIFRPATTI